MDAAVRKARTKLVYNGIAPFYDRLRLMLNRKDIPTVLDLLDIHETDKVLDAGMGPGIYTFEILKRNKLESVTGIDICEQFIKIAQKKAQKRNYDNVTFKIADIEALPFEDHIFDKIVCSGVMLLVPNRDVALHELFRVLKPGGKIVFVEPLNDVYVSKEIFYVFGKLLIHFLAMKNPQLKGLGRSDFAGNYFSEEELFTLLSGVGFRDVNVIRNEIEVYGVCEK